MEAAAMKCSTGRKTHWGLESKPCDTCRSTPSVLFCQPDSTFLCRACDARSHSHHAGVQLCEVCERSPATLTCKADAAILCTSCDADIHSTNLLARRHERLPIVSSISNNGVFCKNRQQQFKEAATEDCFLGFGDPGEDVVDVDYTKGTDYFFSVDVDPYLDLEYADGLVPVQQQEMKVVHRDGGVAVGVRQQQQPLIDFDHSVRSNGSSYDSCTYSVSSSEVGVVPDDASNGYMNGTSGGNVQMSAAAAAGTTKDREARVMRYPEKRKSRRFEKTIRYASRKAYAETRPRIKGRFAKREEVEAEGMLVRIRCGAFVLRG